MDHGHAILVHTDSRIVPMLFHHATANQKKSYRPRSRLENLLQENYKTDKSAHCKGFENRQPCVH